MKKIIALVMTLALAFSCLAGCAKEEAKGGSDLENLAAEAAQEGAAEQAEERLQMELYYVPWTGIPIEGDDAYIQWINETTGVDWKLTYASDFEKISTRQFTHNGNIKIDKKNVSF